VNLKTTILIIALLIFPVAAFAGNSDSEAANEQCNWQQYQKFGDRFFQAGEFYRAVTMYELAIACEPSLAEAAKIRFAIGRTYQLARRSDDAILAFSTVKTVYSDQPELASEAAFRMAETFYQDDKVRLSLNSLDSLIAQYPDSDFASQALYLKALLYAEKGDYNTSSRLFRELTEKYPESPLTARAGELAKTVEQGHDLQGKSPGLASLLSIIPGLGQVYCEQYGDATMAFIVNAIFGVLIWDSVRKAENIPHYGYGSTVVFAFIGSSFYFGNIYGAGAGAMRYNRNVRENFMGRVRNRAMIPGLKFEIKF
jgi:tetratricopeptide (TPR) repeat protein